MRTELVKVTTSDGLRLDGSLQEPARCRATSETPDAYLLLHGVGGTFYGGNMFDALTQPLLNQTGAVLRVNTRGAGAVTMFATNGGATRGGAAFEVVDQCRYDINAWCDFLVAKGYQRIALLGHSLGAIKALYATAHACHPQVTHLIAASPPRLSYTAFQHDDRSSLFFESLRTAEQLVAEGKPETIFTAKFPFPLLITAASYLDKYGPEERYNILRFTGELRSRPYSSMENVNWRVAGRRLLVSPPRLPSRRGATRTSPSTKSLMPITSTPTATNSSPKPSPRG